MLQDAQKQSQKNIRIFNVENSFNVKDKNHRTSLNSSKKDLLSKLIFKATKSYHNNTQVKFQQQINQIIKDK